MVFLLVRRWNYAVELVAVYARSASAPTPARMKGVRTFMRRLRRFEEQRLR